MAIINSLLDTDLYKLTMAQAVYHNYPGAIVRYKFKCRNYKKVTHLHEINKELDHFCSLRFTEDEISYLSSFTFFTKDFIRYLCFFQLNRNYIKTYLDKDMNLQIEIEGPWISTIFFEVPVLAIISEIYSKYQVLSLPEDNDIESAIKKGKKIFKKKINYLTEQLKTGTIAEFKFADFGTRRRFSFEWQDFIIDTLRKKFRPYLFVGTSNVSLAKKYAIRPIGTMGHEWLQAHQQLHFDLAESQKVALDVWAREYRGELGIALSDCLGFKAFLKDFDLYFAKLFDGCRHDSGDPISWCVKLVEHYDKLGIDPKTKTAVFSDSLDFPKAVEIHETLNDMINISFAIGTNLTNDMGFTPLQSVIKMVECNGEPVAKLADCEGKCMCDNVKFIAKLKKSYDIQD